VTASPQAKFFEPFFRDFFGRGTEPDESRERTLQGLGSGVIISSDGYIVTNNHVIENAEDIRVTLHDNRKFKAELVGTDALTEIAVIRIDGEDLPIAVLGDSDGLQIGEWVLAFGNPLHLRSTVTAGIISAKGRAIGIIRDEQAAETGGSFAIENFIQTDAAINPGNSGGPLVDLDAKVIGINTAIASRTGGYQGYGFAVPIDLARKVMDDLIDQGYVTRAWMGISMMAVNERIARRYGMDRPTGVIIQQVVDGSPADDAGLELLDIILAMEGIDIERTNEVQNMVALRDPGDEVELEILRDGKKMEKSVELGERQRTAAASRKKETDASQLGMTVQNLTPALQSQLGHDHYDPSDGVVVTEVTPYGAAWDAGIRAGDLITTVEDTDVDSVSDYRNAMKDFDGGEVVILTVQRGSGSLHAFVELPEE